MPASKKERDKAVKRYMDADARRKKREEEERSTAAPMGLKAAGKGMLKGAIDFLTSKGSTRFIDEANKKLKKGK